jgi:hypothetical protein
MYISTHIIVCMYVCIYTPHSRQHHVLKGPNLHGCKYLPIYLLIFSTFSFYFSTHTEQHTIYFRLCDANYTDVAHLQCAKYMHLVLDSLAIFSNLQITVLWGVTPCTVMTKLLASCWNGNEEAIC